MSNSNELDFEEFIAECSKKFNLPVYIAVHKDYQHDQLYKSTKMRDSKPKSIRINVVASDQYTNSSETPHQMDSDPLEHTDEQTLSITAIYDSINHFAEIQMTKFHFQSIPRVIMKLIASVLPVYSRLSKFTIKSCRIDMFTVYELSKMLPFTTITEVCLDECPLPQGNYDILLNDSGNIKNLSLCRCRINDDVCERIALKLWYSGSAKEHLVALNLTSNHITDVGAKHLAKALRTNRHLRYLSLADNLLSDKGASHIFDTLIEFPLTYKEIMDKRHRYMSYLKKKQAIYVDCLQKNCHLPSVESISNKTTTVKKVSPIKSRASLKREKPKTNLSEDNARKAKMIAIELAGPFADPFSPSNARVKNGYPCCMGNFVLCYLNLAYNDMTYVSVKKLLSVIEYQHEENTAMCGLMKVILEGNYLPANCIELVTLNHKMHTRIAHFNNKHLVGRESVPRSGIEKKNRPFN